MQPPSNDETLLTTAMRNNFQLGVFSRASRIFMQCSDFSHFCRYVMDTLEELGLSGRVKLSAAGDTFHKPFGQGICPEVYSSLADLASCTSKTLCGAKFFIFNTHHVLLILDSDNTGDMELDLLVDNITIYMDTIHYWLDQHQKMADERADIQHERTRVISNLNSFIDCIARLNQHLTQAQQAVNEELLTQLMGIFPVLGMEADQEDIILNIVHDARRKERALLDQQLRQNEDLRTVMRQAIAALTSSHCSPSMAANRQPESESVTLF